MIFPFVWPFLFQRKPRRLRCLQSTPIEYPSDWLLIRLKCFHKRRTGSLKIRDFPFSHKRKMLSELHAASSLSEICIFPKFFTSSNCNMVDGLKSGEIICLDIICSFFYSFFAYEVMGFISNSQLFKKKPTFIISYTVRAFIAAWHVRFNLTMFSRKKK